MRVAFGLALTALLAGTAAAEKDTKPRVWYGPTSCSGFGKGCSLKLHDGLEETLYFQLEEPIICPPSSTKECIVVVNISNSHPEWVSVNPCLLSWSASEWHQKKSVKVSAVQDYVHENADRQVHLETQVTGTDSELYAGFNPEDIYIESKKAGSAQCRATGDPHYTTFDGMYWHFYDGNRRQPTRLTYYKSTVRDFVMQVQVRGNPAVACAIAGREGDDRVMINNCGGGVSVVADYRTKKVEDQPRIDVSGNTYTVYFKSGAWIRASVAGWGMNVYTESVDPGASCGLCGDFDGNPSNDAVAYQVQDWNTLYPCQKVCTKSLGCTQCTVGARSGTSTPCDIWEYTPPDANDQTEKVPVAKKLCPYEPSYVKPLIGVQDVEDLTEFLKQHTEEEEDRGVFVFDVDQEDFEAGEKYDEVKSKKECTAFISTEMVVECKKMDPGGTEFNEKFDEVLDDCAQDYSELGGPKTQDGLDELIESRSILENTCIELFIRWGHRNCVDDSCMKLKNVLCPNQCSGNGQCLDAACQCDATWAGKSCSISKKEPPAVVSISDDLCDTANGDFCPDEIVVSGTGFYCDKRCNDPSNDFGPQCKFNLEGADAVVVEATFVGEDAVLCPVPKGSGPGLHRGAEVLRANLEVSNGGNDPFTTAKHDFVFFDSECLICDAESAECAPNPDTCQVQIGDRKQCFSPGEKDPRTPDGFSAPNPCLRCDPTASQTEFSYRFDGDQCEPQFDKEPFYDYVIAGEMAAGPVPGLMVDGGTNRNVNGAPGYKVTYSLNTPPGGNDDQIKNFFDVDPATGQIKLVKAVSIKDLCNDMTHCASDPTKFNGFFAVEACHQNTAACAISNIIVELVSEDNDKPFFSEPIYEAVILEGAASGATLEVEPSLKNEDDSDATYSFFSTGINLDRNTFQINSKTAKITVKEAEFLDYEAVDLHHCSRFNTEAQCGIYLVCQWAKEPVSGRAGDEVEHQCHMKPITMVVKAVDASGNSHYADVELRVVDEQEAPTAITLAPSVLDENSAPGTVVGELQCVDPEVGDEPSDSCTFELAGKSGQMFEVVTNGTQSTLATKQAFNYEGLLLSMGGTLPQVTVSLVATDRDGKVSVPMEIVIDITDINEKPEDIVLTAEKSVSLNGNVLTLSESQAVGTLLGSVKSTDPDADTEDVPACQLVSGGAFLEMSNNQLFIGSALDFETAPVVKFGIACIDRPGADSGFTPLVSDAVNYEIQVTNANDAPEGLSLSQSKTLDEGQEITDKVEVGTVTAIDADADAGAFEMVVQDTEAWELGALQCADVGGQMQCRAALFLKKSLSSAGDAACSAPDATGTVGCQVSIALIDGTDSTLIRSPTESVTVKFKDVFDAPSGVTTGISQIEAQWEDGHVFGTVTVDDADGTDGANGRPGHQVTLKSTDDAVGLQSATASSGRGRRSGTSEWKMVVERARAIDPRINAEIKLEFTVVDLLKPEEPYTFSYTLPVVSDGVGGTGSTGGAAESAGGIELKYHLVTVPFRYRNTGPLEHKYILEGADMRDVELVKLSTEGIGACPPAQLKILLPNSAGYTSDEKGTKSLCEWDAGETGFEMLGLAVGQSSAETLLQPLGGAVEGTYGETVFDNYFKVTKKDGLEAYLSLTVKYLDSCGVACAEGGKCASTPCAGNEICMQCDLGIDQVPDFALASCAKANADGYQCINEGAGEVALLDDLVAATKAKGDGIQSQLDELQCDTVMDGATAAECAELQEQLEVVKDEVDKTEMELIEKQLVAGMVDKSLVKAKLASTQEQAAATDAQLEGLGCVGEVAVDSQECTLLLREKERLRQNLVTLDTAAKSTSADDATKDKGGGGGAVIGIVIAILLIVIIVVGILLWRNQKKKEEEMQRKMAVYADGAVSNPGYDQRGAVPDEAKFIPGQTNPLYDWYHPAMSRPQTDQHLQSSGDGAFLVRDSQSTPGWYMLCVKSQGAVMHEKVRLGDDGKFELLATNAPAQPGFASIPEVVEHYTMQQPGVPYVLKLANSVQEQIGGVGNPMYGMGADPNLAATYDEVNSPA